MPDARDHERSAVAAERVLQDARELAVAIPATRLGRTKTKPVVITGNARHMSGLASHVAEG